MKVNWKKAVRQSAISCFTVFYLMLPLQAVEIDVATHNRNISQQWVNWYPGELPQSAEVTRLAKELREEAGSPEMVPLAIHDWICKNICYDWDAYNSEQYSTLRPDDVLRERRGVCEAIANLTQALYLASDIPCIKVWGVCIPEGESWSAEMSALERANHTWNEFSWNGRWVTIDCTMDIKSKYLNGEATYLPGIIDYFDPDETFFAQTHKRLRRGFDLPENVPDRWALPAVQKAADGAFIPLELLSGYSEPVTCGEFLRLLGEASGEDKLLRRIEAAMITASFLKDSESGVFPYLDAAGYTQEEQAALSILFQRKIMVGTGPDTFSPEEYLTRQEAIAIVSRMFEEGILCT